MSRIAIAAFSLIGLAGCARYALTAEDGIVLPGERTRLRAYVKQEHVFLTRSGVDNVRVEFLVDGRPVGADLSDDDGHALLFVDDLPGDGERVEARARIGNQELSARSRLFHWDPERIVLVVDVDGTVSRTDFSDLYLHEEDDESIPFHLTVETLRALADDYQILYLTARPRALLDPTRAWLDRNGLPPGPVLAPGPLIAGLAAEHYKERMLEELREYLPNARIGIGNEASDARAYGANNMLAVIVFPEADTESGLHAVRLRDWRAVARFFRTNRDVLVNPDALDEVIDGERPLMLYLSPFRPE